jgi:hypothetical protein
MKQYKIIEITNLDEKSLVLLDERVHCFIGSLYNLLKSLPYEDSLKLKFLKFWTVKCETQINKINIILNIFDILNKRYHEKDLIICILNDDSFYSNMSINKRDIKNWVETAKGESNVFWINTQS